MYGARYFKALAPLPTGRQSTTQGLAQACDLTWLAHGVWRNPARNLAHHSLAEWLDMHQEVAFPHQPALAIWRQGKGWHQIVVVGVVAQVADPGLQDAEHANLPAE